MATQVAELVAQLKLQSEAFERKLDGIQKQVRGARKDFNELGNSVKSWAAGFLTVEAALRGVQFVGRVLIEAEQSSAKLNAVLKATGHTAGLTSEDLKQLADQLERTTLFDDKEILNASAVLATFRSVSGETFTQTIRLAADMSAVFGGDLQSSVTMLGKALEDPTTGLTALRRVGVSFNEQQKDTITKLLEQNKLFEAQQEILKGVAVQVEGAAASMGDTGLSGSINLLTDAVENMIEANLDMQNGKVPAWVETLADIISRIRRDSVGLFLAAPEQLRMPAVTVSAADLAGKLSPMSVTANAPGGKAEKEALERAKEHADFLDDQATRAIENYNHHVRELQHSYEEAGEAAVNALEAEEKARQRLLDDLREATTAHQQREQDAAQRIFDQNAHLVDEMLAQEKKLAESEAAEQWRQGWGMAIDGVAASFESSIYGLLNRQITTWKAFAAEVLSIWQRTLAQMAAMQAGGAITGFLSTLVMNGLGAAFGRNPNPSGFVDSLPATPGQTVASIGGGGGLAPANVTVNLSLNAIDARSGSEFLMQNRGAIAGAFVEELKGNRQLGHFLAAAGR